MRARSSQVWIAAGLAALTLACSASHAADPGRAVDETARSTALDPEPTPSSTLPVPETTSVPETTTTAVTATTTRPAPSNALGAVAGHVIVLDPGHNGGDSAHLKEITTQVFIGNGSKDCESTGTAGNDGYPEHAFTYDVVRRLQAILTQAGAEVVVTRPSDDGWGPCVTQRAAIGNDAHGELAISVHADGGPSAGRGFHVIRPLPVPGYNDGIVEPSGRFATLLRDTFAGDTGMPTATYVAENGLVSRSDLGGLNMSKVPKVFIECGNMRNRTDEAMLHDPSWRQKAAEAIAVAMNTYFAST